MVRYLKRLINHISDLDLAIDGKKPLGIIKIQQIKEAFASSLLPYRVDVVDYNSVSTEFREIIDQGNEVIFDGKNS